ncbi:MAG: hypothetical protein K0Q77_42 [Anaerosporomusa subterranea]|nr:hypothetical protein [Anaerosporomusa subterranea]
MKQSPLKRRSSLQAKTRLSSRASLKSRGKIKAKSNKKKPGRLYGEELIELYEFVWKRDNKRCIFCDRPIPQGTIPHHEKPKGRGGKDRKEDMVMLCQDAPVNPCHYRRHNGPGSQELRQFCLDYLYKRYPDTK